MKKVITQIAQTDERIAPLILRITLAVVLWPHGAQLLLGWFGGAGYASTIDYFKGGGLPYIIAFLVIMIQFFGSLMVFVGLYTRIVAIAILIMFIGMIITAHWPIGFFMNWTGTLKGEGFEYHLLVIGICLSIILSGSGRLSLDGLFYKISNH
jgi:putative oxidoreductase